MAFVPDKVHLGQGFITRELFIELMKYGGFDPTESYDIFENATLDIALGKRSEQQVEAEFIHLLKFCLRERFEGFWNSLFTKGK